MSMIATAAALIPSTSRLDPAPLLPGFAQDGYAVLPQALPTPLLGRLREAFDRLMVGPIAAEPQSLQHQVNRVIERDPAFLELIDLPSVFPLVRAIIGADVTLAAGGEAYSKRPHSPAFISWHNDFQWMVDVPYPRQNFWVRATYFLDDIDEDTAPMALLPGTHRADHECPADLTGPDGQPRELPGMVRLTGKAGDCVVNHTEIWHTNTPNRGTRIRKLVMLTYKHAWMRQWGDGHDIQVAFAETQTDPLRRQLCGLGDWHRCDRVWAT
ncbi:MAG: phytanoyl-CoA dioxygenase family protein [Planctomycetes bacterium]|nr:phytanoyl-CoA dioxygenase family protein [Planctomycetota bacterium]